MYSQMEVNALLTAAMPDVTSSTVLIVGAKRLVGEERPKFGPFGTGVLFQIADVHFVITAAHIVRDAHKASITVGMSCDDNSFLVFRHDFTILDVASFPAFDDTFDVALYKLSDGEVDRLKSSRFLRQSDVGEVIDNGICTVFGYPGALTDHVQGDEPLKPKGLTFTVPVYTGSTHELHGFDGGYSFLLEANSTYSTGMDGQKMQMSDLSGRASDTLSDLRGMSGGPVWMIATSGTNPATWNRDLPKLVGLQVSVYREHELVRATRWSGVLGFIKMVYPELSPALEMIF